MQAVVPPVNATNLVVFLEHRPEVAKIRRFDRDGKPYLEVFLPLPRSVLSLPSGPPTYIFDEVSGALVDWTADRGDSPTFVNKWGSLSNAAYISVDEARILAK